MSDPIAPDFVTALAIGDLPIDAVRSLTWESRVSEPPVARVIALLPVETPLDALLGAPAFIGFGIATPGDAAQQGIVIEVTIEETDALADGGILVEIVIGSTMWLLGQTRDCRVFLNKALQAIVTEVCADHGIDKKSLDFRLTEKHDTWPMTNQYDETALAFVSRLCEAEGVIWTSEVSDDGEKIVFTDRSSNADAAPGNGVKVIEGIAAVDLEVVHAVAQGERVVTGKVSLRDYDFTRPKLDIAGDAQAATDTDLEAYDYAPGVIEPERAAFRAKVRLEAIQAAKKTVEIEGRSLTVRPGRILKVSGAEAGLDGEYFVVSVEQRLEKDRSAALFTRAKLVPKDVPYRAPLVTPKPVVSGLETALVVAPRGADVETIHTDEHARVKVKLPWDRSDRVADDASHWLRVMQLQTYDSLILPRIGWEVVLDYLEGDPDKAVVLGRVYNGLTMPPYALPEGKTRTAIQSASSPGGGGRNEIRMEDGAGREEVSVTAEKDQTISVGGNKTTTVVANSKREVGSNSKTKVGGDQEIQITSGYNNGAATQTVDVGGSRELKVSAVVGWTSGGASTTDVGGSQTEMIGNPLKGLLDLAGQVAVEAVKNEASKAMSDLEGAVNGKIDQVMAPVNDVKSKLGQVNDALGGKPSEMAGGLDALGNLPSPGDIAQGMMGKGKSAIDNAIAGAGKNAQKALGLDPGDDHGESEANKPGVDGSVGGNSASDSACGPGYSITKVSSAHTESVGGSKIVLAAGKIATSVAGARTTTVSSLELEAVAGSRVETCLADKTETSVGTIIAASGNDVEEVGGARTTMVGGAVMEKVSGGATVSAGGKLLMAGAFWKIDASSSIVISCGGSKVTIGGGGIAIEASAVTITAPKIALESTTSEV